MGNRFLVHRSGDSVGVAVEDIASDEIAHGVVQEDGNIVEVRAIDPIPLGHKIALRDIEAGGQVIKYGVPIGVATRPIKAGQHVHIHNLKSARWA